MRYIQLSITAHPSSDDVTDILSFYLGNIGYNSFIASKNGLEAYIPQQDFSEQKLNEVLHSLTIEMNDLLKDVKLAYEYNLLEEKNWNKEWEKNYFEPLVVSNKCCVRSSFHTIDKQYDYEIIIDPKMAFGTGHHQTTYLMLQEILKLDVKQRTVLDMGCGTAVLAILAAKMGASNVVAIDFDEWAYHNAKENTVLNRMANVTVRLGEVGLIQDENYNFVFANINRNVLLQDIQHYAKAMNSGAILIMSGFYTDDVPSIKKECEKNNLSFQKTEQKDNWCAVVCHKK